MKTPAVIYEEFGDPGTVLKGVTMNTPSTMKDNEVLLKMLMAPINPSDINMIQGTYMLKPTLPAVCGNEGVGRVIKVGPKVKTLKEGDLAIPANPGCGTWCGHLHAKESVLQKIDSDIPILSAATIAVNPCTAYRMLKDFKELKPGDVVIQNAANSAVGQSVIQIAKAWGLKTINIIRNRENLEITEKYLKDLGANVVVTEEFCRSPQMKDVIKDMGQIPQLALNGVGGKSATELLRALDKKGVLVTYGGMSRQPVIVPTGVFIFKEIIAVGYWNSQWNYDNIGNPEKDHMFNELCEMIRKGQLLPPASNFIQLENFQMAVKGALEGFQSTKRILVMDDELYSLYYASISANEAKTSEK